MSKASRKQRYMLEASQAILSVRPELSGKLDWNAILHFYHTSLPISKVAAEYLSVSREVSLPYYSRN